MAKLDFFMVKCFLGRVKAIDNLQVPYDSILDCDLKNIHSG